jgi:hypothetical protein
MLRVATLLILLCETASAQLAIRNGVGIPTRDTLRILIVFAEVDFNDGPCSGNVSEDFKGDWPVDRNGKTRPPSFAHDFLDAELDDAGKMQGFITRFYHEASFGQYVLLGDHLPEVVTIPCKEARSGNHGLNQIIERMALMRTNDSTLFTSRGLPLKAFDQWTNTGQGKPKEKLPDGSIDLLYIIWRNNRMLTGPNTRDHAGYGVTGARGKPFKDMQGVANMASFNVSKDPEKGAHITIAEHLHGIFGGNHWHSAGGRGMHTFLMPPATYGLTAQSGGTMLAASGWDRWMMDWKPERKRFTTSALNTDREEVITEMVTWENFPLEQTFILRDHMTTGDAIRIKLPFIDWQKNGDIKNQYLWLENRRMTVHSDRYLEAECANNGNGRFPRGTPGIYAYIQVGKDQREGDNGIYGSQPQQPNGLASPFFPLPAEGRFDFHFRRDRVQPGDFGIGCNWGIENIPKDMRRSKENPFTGLSDLYCQMDFNEDGKMYSGDKIYTGMSKMQGDSAIHDYHMNGDWLDAFSTATGKMELSISTNPAPVTVYTYSSNFEFGQFGFRNGEMAAHENRNIHLNGLSLRFEELENGEMKVHLRWDDYEVRNDVRWCGTIVQHPNMLRKELPSLKLADRKKITLARGESPQYHEALGKNRKGEWIFADATTYTVTTGSVVELGARAKLIVDDDSHLIFEKSSILILGEKARIVVGKNARLTLNDAETEVVFGKGARIIRK